MESHALALSDNTKVRVPFAGPRGRPEQKYGSISGVYTHQAWPSGPELCVLQIDWCADHGRSEISGNPLVGPPDSTDDTFPRCLSAVEISECGQTVTFLSLGSLLLAAAIKSQSPCGPTIHCILRMLLTQQASCSRSLIETRMKTRRV